jgi:hypothetical protein
MKAQERIYLERKAGVTKKKSKHKKGLNENYDSRKRPDPRKPEFAEEPEDGSTEELEGYRSSKAKTVPGSTAGVKSR